MLLTKEQKEVLKAFIEFNKNTTKEQKELLKLTIDTSSTFEELGNKLIIIQIL